MNEKITDFFTRADSAQCNHCLMSNFEITKVRMGADVLSCVVLIPARQRSFKQMRWFRWRKLCLHPNFARQVLVLNTAHYKTFFKFSFSRSNNTAPVTFHQCPIVQKVENAIHWINLYPQNWFRRIVIYR